MGIDRSVESQVGGAVGAHVSAARVEKPLGPESIAVMRMVDGDGRLNQSLIKPPVAAGRVAPESFPDLVGIEIFSRVEQGNPF